MLCLALKCQNARETRRNGNKREENDAINLLGDKMNDDRFFVFNLLAMMNFKFRFHVGYDVQNGVASS